MGATSANGKDSVSANRRVVFVDPDDENALWWWPALVVPPKEFQQFRQTMGIEIEEPKDGEYLVCYFEDGSSSVVPEGAAMPFCPTKPPYTTYSNGRNGPAFLEDNAVRLATEYWTNGTAPPSFIWLHVANGSGSISKAVAPQSISKRRPSISLQSRQSSAEKEGASSVSIKPSGRHQGDAPPPKKSKKDHSHGHSSESARREKEKERDKSHKSKSVNQVPASSASSKKSSHKRLDLEAYIRTHSYIKSRKRSRSPFLSSDSSSSDSEDHTTASDSRKRETSGASHKVEVPESSRPVTPQSTMYYCGGIGCSNIACGCPRRKQPDEAKSSQGSVFNPICVMKRSDRPELSTIRDMVPLSVKKVWMERLEALKHGVVALAHTLPPQVVPQQANLQSNQMALLSSPKPAQISATTYGTLHPVVYARQMPSPQVVPQMYPGPEFTQLQPKSHQPDFAETPSPAQLGGHTGATMPPPPPLPPVRPSSSVVHIVSNAPLVQQHQHSGQLPVYYVQQSANSQIILSPQQQHQQPQPLQQLAQSATSQAVGSQPSGRKATIGSSLPQTSQHYYYLPQHQPSPSTSSSSLPSPVPSQHPSHTRTVHMHQQQQLPSPPAHVAPTHGGNDLPLSSSATFAATQPLLTTPGLPVNGNSIGVAATSYGSPRAYARAVSNTGVSPASSALEIDGGRLPPRVGGTGPIDSSLYREPEVALS